MKYQFNQDSDILVALKSYDSETYNAALRHLFGDKKLLNTIRKQIFGMEGDENDVQEVFGQALFEFYKKVSNDIYDPSKSAITTYIVHIAQNKFYTKKRSDIRRKERNERAFAQGEMEILPNIEKELDYQDKKELLGRLLGNMNPKCPKIMLLNHEKYSMTEIAEKMNYKSKDVAKMALYNCREKLNLFLKDRPDLRDELREL
jgi:RNA polymerase sigma factor (sigma-70 family)